MSLTEALGRAPLSGASISPAELDAQRGEVWLFDQRERGALVRCASADEVLSAVRAGVVEGDPAIGIAAAYALALFAHAEDGEARSFLLGNGVAGRVLASLRPGAPSVQRALARMSRVAATVAPAERAARYEAMAAEAMAHHRDEVEACRALGARVAEGLPAGLNLVTLGHTGGLATGGYGTAQGVARAAWEAGKLARVLVVDGSERSLFELAEAGIPAAPASLEEALALEGALALVAAERVALDGDFSAARGALTLLERARDRGVPALGVALSELIDREAPSRAALPGGGDLIPAALVGGLALERA